MATLAGDVSAVKRFTAAGGWLVAWGVTPESLASFDALVGVDHLIRPFRRERVSLRPVRDSLVAGLCTDDLTMGTSQSIDSWSDRTFAAADTFSYIVDADDDIAPFCTYPSWKVFNPGQPRPSPDRDPFNLVNGFTTQDGWQYIFQIAIFNAQGLEWDVMMPRPETLTQLELINNGLYGMLTRIEVTFDQDPARTVPLDIAPVKDAVQSRPLPARPCTRMHVKLAGWTEGAKTVGIDNWWIRIQRSPELRDHVVPLLNIGGLVKYPQGAGGVLLCNLNVPVQEPIAANAVKRLRLVNVLLRNLGAASPALPASGPLQDK